MIDPKRAMTAVLIDEDEMVVLAATRRATDPWLDVPVCHRDIVRHYNAQFEPEFDLLRRIDRGAWSS
ncbi:MAG: hypothetical protein IT477_10820 [Rhodanobacteraceae bacterium]|nr:hypothetical protein [Rhodanobacteraceae bacterium]